jgi:hypothetical protein
MLVVLVFFPFMFSLDLSGGLGFGLSYVLDLIPCRFFVACARGFFMCWFFCSRAKAIGQFSLPNNFRQCLSDLLHVRSWIHASCCLCSAA